jgi:hypothetical protein
MQSDVMRHLLLAAVLVSGLSVGLSAASASPVSSAPLVLSPRAVDFGPALHAGQQGSADVTVSNQGGLPRLFKRISIDAGSGCRSFGPTCPLQIVHESGSCPSSGPLGQGQQCQITLAFAPAAAGDLSVSVCIDSLGPIGVDVIATAARSCVPVRAHVLAAAGGKPSAPGGTSPARPGAAKPPTPTTSGRTTIPVVASPWSSTPTQSPTAVPLAWRSAGAFVWHTDGIDPTHLGLEMRANGFGWVAIRIHDGKTADKIDPDWIAQFRLASGLPVGGWGVLRDQPGPEARLAGSLIGKLGLDFYIADAELEYEYSNQGGQSAQRLARSAAFVSAFRAVEPTLPGAVSSYCRADRHDIDWAAWRGAGFAFMPQAYVDQFGAVASPAACAAGAAGIFAPGDVHPTVGTYPSSHGLPSPAAYGQMLKAAGTVGFSLYLAETTPDNAWFDYGQAISSLGIAA